jgi:hypothetical protein
MDLFPLARRWRWVDTVRRVTFPARRALGFDNPSRWLDPAELPDGIEIARLVSPLRYDIIARREFFQLYAARRELYRHDFDAFLALARHGSYRVYVEAAAAERLRRRITRPDALRALFAGKVREAAALFESWTERGFDARYPITLETAEVILPSMDRRGRPTGKRIAERFFVADGGHRIALLMLAGGSLLPRHHVRVLGRRRLHPFDNTRALVRSLQLDRATYFAFLSGGYAAPFVFTEGGPLLAHVGERNPQRLAELRDVIRADGFAEASS